MKTKNQNQRLTLKKIFKIILDKSKNFWNYLHKPFNKKGLGKKFYDFCFVSLMLILLIVMPIVLVIIGSLSPENTWQLFYGFFTFVCIFTFGIIFFARYKKTHQQIEQEIIEQSLAKINQTPKSIEKLEKKQKVKTKKN